MVRCFCTVLHDNYQTCLPVEGTTQYWCLGDACRRDTISDGSGNNITMLWCTKTQPGDVQPECMYFDRGPNHVCCNDRDFCNGNSVTGVDPTAGSLLTSAGHGGASWALILTAVVVPAFLLTMLIFLCRRRQFCRTQRRFFPRTGSETDTDESYIVSVSERTPVSAISSGRASTFDSAAYSQIQCRGLSRQIEFCKTIGRGRFSEVFMGKLNGQEVAIKVFHSAEDNSFFWEKELFESGHLNHEGIVRFIVSDIHDAGVETRRMLVTEYHAIGSLFDFLDTHEIDLNKALCLRLATSLANGLAFLHSDQKEVPTKTGGSSRRVHFAPQEREHILLGKGSDAISNENSSLPPDTDTRKVPMAHCDLKTRNILVQDDFTCCLTDFGMAFRYHGDYGVERKSTHSERAGTRRYLAPEVLDGTIERYSIVAHQSTDIYALALVLWEIFTCCMLTGEHCDYVQPYATCVSSEPEWEDMQNIVCIQNIRPELPHEVTVDKDLSSLQTLLDACWSANIHRRWTAQVVYNFLASLQTTVGDEDHSTLSCGSE